MQNEMTQQVHCTHEVQIDRAHLSCDRIRPDDSVIEGRLRTRQFIYRLQSIARLNLLRHRSMQKSRTTL